MKTLGLIGGTSWHSTVDYYRHINTMVNKKLGALVTPPLLMYSLNVQLMVRGDWETEIPRTYLDIAKNLQKGGAKAIIICANTPHKVLPFVAPKIDIPFIHIADAIGKNAKNLGLKNLGLLGTTPVMEEDFIKKPLEEQHQIQTKIPNELVRKRIHDIIVKELTNGIFKESTKKYIIEEMEKLKSEGADGIILGCTELPILLQPEDFDLPMLDTTYLHAKKAVEFILS